MPSDGDRARALLAYANYAKVATALLVSRAAVADWAKGRSVTPYRLRQLEQLLRPDLQTKEAAPPEWAERLEQKVDAIYERQNTVAATASRQVIEALADPERLAWVERLAAMIQGASPSTSSEGSDDPRDTEAPGGASTADPGLGSFQRRGAED